uniref:Uncharacterized protein MANES_01G020400 n=1 Tax=Rhizophora mucronata TaxID=61149 RepID=A0A2P2L5R4_RHIMU
MVLEIKNPSANGEAVLHRKSNGVSSVASDGHVNFGSNGTVVEHDSGGDTLNGEDSITVGAVDAPDVITKKERQREMTFQDMYNNQGLFDEDDEEDSDWEPVQKRVEIVKWFCTNCTMVNLNDVIHCDICGEHRESGILRHGFFSSPFSQAADLTEDICLQHPASISSTAVGFDERMLLHSEVEMKSHLHPERPDRLQAIAASLATAGIFPGRCFPISAREITHEELQMVHSLEHIQTVELTSHIFSRYIKFLPLSLSCLCLLLCVYVPCILYKDLGSKARK